MEKLALFGGPRAVPGGMVQTWPPFTQQDREAVLSVFDANILHGTSAPNAVALQEEFAEFLGVRHCLVTNSGTSALHMAIAALGIGPGDDVIVPAFTYWSTAAAVLHHNAVPVFVDIEADSWCIDPAAVERAITDRTRAILPVHIHGMPADMDGVMAVARAHNLRVVGDCCQAHGAAFRGRKVGTIEDTAGFSTNRSKNLSSGEGGLFVTNDDEAFHAARLLREFGEVVIHGQDREYNAYGMGWMYRSHEFVNAFCRSQLRRLPQYNAARREMAAFLTDALAQIPGVAGPLTPPGRDPVYFSYIVEFRPRELDLDVPVAVFKKAVIQALAAEGIRLGQWQRMPVPAQSVFQAKEGYGKGCPWSCPFYGRPIEYRGDDYPVTVRFIAEHSYLAGVHPPNGQPLMERYVHGFQKVLGQPDAIRKLIDKPQS